MKNVLFASALVIAGIVIPGVSQAECYKLCTSTGGRYYCTEDGDVPPSTPPICPATTGSSLLPETQAAGTSTQCEMRQVQDELTGELQTTLVCG